MNRMKPFIVDDPIYLKCREKLFSKEAKKIIRANVKKGKLKSELKKFYNSEFLTAYYSPILATIYKKFKTLKGKKMLEIGYRIPIFLDYLKSVGVDAVGIDIDPYVDGDNAYKMDIERIPKWFKIKYAHEFDVVFERLTLSRLYDEIHILEKGRPRFRNKKKILSNIKELLKPGGLFVLQDDRGSIFTIGELRKTGFRKAMRDTPIILKDRNGRYLGWNTLEAYSLPQD